MHPLVLPDVEVFLRRRFGADDVEELTGGTWSRAFAFNAGGARLVARFGGSRTEYAKDRLASTWSSPALPVPDVLDVGDAFDRPYALTRHVVGDPLDGLDVDGWHRTLPALLGALDAMGDVRLPGTRYGRFDEHGDATHRTWSEWLHSGLVDEPVRAGSDGGSDGDDRRRLVGWRAALASVPGASERYETGVERFCTMATACPEVRLVVHTDLGAGNTLTADGRITGIIDWGNAVAGDPLYDVAHLTFWAPWHPGCPEQLLRDAAAEAFGPHVADRLLAYELHIALAEQRFNAAMGRLQVLDAVAGRAIQLATRRG